MRSRAALLSAIVLASALPARAQIILPPRAQRPRNFRTRAIPPQPVPEPLDSIPSAPVASANGSEVIEGTVIVLAGPVGGAVVTAIANTKSAALYDLLGECVSCTGENHALCACGDNVRVSEERFRSRRDEGTAVARTITSPEGSFALTGHRGA
jgi:hypothetical protein